MESSRTPTASDADVALQQECPYKSMPPTSYWRRSVAEVHYRSIDPVVDAAVIVKSTDRVATAGSCFAQHIARRLRDSGFTYFVAERAPSCIHPDIAARYNYGTFSARYGNVYTTRQLRQLVDRAHGIFTPAEPFWLERDRVIDPFRPQIQPGGFQSLREAELDREYHLFSVRQMLRTMNVFVFTLGLTETWESVEDGAVFPICPGCGAGSFSDKKYRFLNLGYEEVRDDLLHVVKAIRQVNPDCRFIFTVSPVPLIATADRQHVLTATTYSKSVLRVAAETVTSMTPGAAYFPSYEIVSGAHARGQYFDDDLRSVKEEGVNHVMSVFFRHFTEADQTPAAQPESQPSTAPRTSGMDLICDEEILEKL
jgi:hypothetical protein